MNSKKIDGRLKLLLENNGVKKYRSVFAICGERPHLVVPILFNFLRKPKGTVLWCYKKSLDFKEKKSKNKQKKRKVDPDEDPFQMFTRSTSIRWCYYHETDRILGNSYDLLVIQDFEALTPNVLARTIETVNGGGLIVFLLKSLESIECLFMDVHKKYQTEAHKDVVSRFNKRFISALQNCQSFIAIDSFFNPLHIAAKITEVESKQEPDQTELKELKNSLKPDPLIGSLVDLCKTIDQSKAVISMIQTLSDKALRTTVSLTASRGRGKSAALGLAVAGAIGYNYCNIFVTSPSPENLKTFFEFVIKGLTALNLKRNFDYDVVNSTEPSHNKSIVMINVLNKFNQKIQYVPPKEIAENSLLKKSAELVIIDEAAAIPLPIVKTFLGPYLVFLSSTIDGYEGTGRALSLKLIEQLRKDVKNVKDVTKESKHQNSKDSPILKEITLKESIRYGDGDEVEVWLNELLCLKNIKTSKKKMDSITNLEDCKLFYINRNVLFSYHSTSEKFLKKLMALYVASHYKNSPNDLQMMADAPAHHLFCLIDSKENVHKKDSESHSQNSLPEVLCFIQVCLEGQISENSLASGLQQNKRASGDLIPWTLAQQFQDNKFPSLSGARVVRITTNPDYVGHGYGRRALKLLFDYFEGEFLNDSDSVSNEDDSETLTQESQALLVSLDERRPERLDYIGVCYGITYDLYRFWKSSGFVPVYLRQTTNELTGENSCIMIKFLVHKRAEFCNSISNDWLIEFWRDFRRRFVSLLDRVFKKFPIQLAYEILTSDENLLSIIEHQYSVDKNKNGLLSPSEIEMIFTDDDFNRCSSFLVNESVSPHGILDCLPVLSYFYFTQRCTSCVELDKKVSYIMIGLGLQRKSFKEISKELSLDYDTMLSYLRKGLKILSATLMKIKHTNDNSKS